jgi:ABC-type phosphate/phosphonate transport system substrate-binding protein
VSYRVGAVAYHPRVVSIWEDFRRWFHDRGLPLEYVLFSTYEAQVDALLDGQVDTAWNTNLAHVQTRLKAGDGCGALAMRDTDRDWTSLALVPAGAPTGVEALRGKRVGFGDSDSSQAWILPAYALRQQGVDPETDLTADRLDRDVGKHGDTGGAELEQIVRLRAGELDASIVSNWTLAALRADGADEGLEVAWTSPPFHHCTFTTVGGDGGRHERFAELLLTMDTADPAICDAMRLENVSRWIEADESGYADLMEAVRWHSG